MRTVGTESNDGEEFPSQIRQFSQKLNPKKQLKKGEEESNLADQFAKIVIEQNAGGLWRILAHSAVSDSVGIRVREHSAGALWKKTTAPYRCLPSSIETCLPLH